MDREQLQPLFDELGLGRLADEPQPVVGGLIHRMWRAVTQQGAFAVKQLNPTIMARLRARADILAGEMIAHQFAQRGLPAIAALRDDCGPIYEIGDDSIMLFEWVEGTTLSGDNVTVEHGRVIGQLLAGMHGARLEIDDLEIPDHRPSEPQHWHTLVQRAAEHGCGWTKELEPVLSVLVPLSEQYADALPRLRAEVVVSHRDLDIKNVMWPSDGRPVMIDWESGGLVNPVWEVLDAALNWCGQTSGQADQARFQALIGSYRGAQPLKPAMVASAYDGCLGARMAWLEFNMQRSLDETTPVDERALATTEVSGTLADILSLAGRRDEYLSWFDEAL